MYTSLLQFLSLEMHLLLLTTDLFRCCVVSSRYLKNLYIDFATDHITIIMSSAKFGFLQKHSTLHQLLLFLDNILMSFKVKLMLSIWTLQKAFDSVAHNELLTKLWKFGITGTLWEWFYLLESNVFIYFQSIASCF